MFPISQFIVADLYFTCVFSLTFSSFRKTIKRIQGKIYLKFVNHLRPMLYFDKVIPRSFSDIFMWGKNLTLEWD